MAVTTGNSPIIMTATGDNIGHRIKLNGLRVVAGANAGDVILRDKSGGKELWRVALIEAEGEAESLFSMGNFGWVDDVYVDTLPTGARVYAYFEARRIHEPYWFDRGDDPFWRIRRRRERESVDLPR